MTGQCKPTSRRTWAILGQVALIGALIVAVGLTPLWSATGVSPKHGNSPKKSLEGSWDVTITTTPDPPFATPFRILRTVSADGVVDAYAFPPITPTTGALINSSGHGTWERSRGARQFKVIVKYFQIDPANFFAVLDSVGTVREDITLAPDGNSYLSSFWTEVALPDGTVVATNVGETTATRITVDEDGDDDDDDDAR